ncbi:MAG: LytTR family DNA-binding domain-containing protein [Oscillospiraceae bacterium]|nr:LytTR family DNA-binding domain-containing protein [Oscillospiraceae bacterium]
MKIIVCDDTASDRLSLCFLLRKYLNEINCAAEVLVYESGTDLLEDLSKIKKDETRLAFLDIYMPGLTGVEVAKKIREDDSEMVIIFTTTSPDHGLDGYSVKALQYLLKPVGYPELKDVLDDCMSLFADHLQYLEVTVDRVAVRIPLKDIAYIEIHAHYGMIHTIKETIKSRMTLDEAEQQLSDKTFLRTHRSFLVNMRYIKSVDDNDFILSNGDIVPIRKNDKLKIKQTYMDYIFEQTRGLK